MSYIQGAPKHTCGLLAVLCGGTSSEKKPEDVSDQGVRFPFPEIVSSGRLEVQSLNNPSMDEFCKVVDSFQPNFVYLQGEQLRNDEVGSLVWGGVDLSTSDALSGLFNVSTLPTTVYLEIPNGEKLAETLHSKGIPYVIYWKSKFSCYAACHFRQALFSVVQSSSSHTWDAFQLAHASFSLYCTRNNLVLPDKSQKVNGKLGPHLLGESPKIDVTLPEMVEGDDEESSPGALPAIKIYDDDVSMRFLVCGVACTLDECLLDSLADGLNALLNIEMRGSKIQNRVSALPPPLQAGTFSRGVVTMRCDLSTCSSAHISLLVSGSAQTCFDDQLLENHIKSEVIEKNQLVYALPTCDENKPPLSEPRTSASVACGSTVFEVSMKVPTWASQVLRQLAPDTSYRCLVALGIASVQGLAVASFEKDDAERLLFFCRKQGKDAHAKTFNGGSPPVWLRPPAPSRKRSVMSQESSRNGLPPGGQAALKREDQEDKETGLMNGITSPLVPVRSKLKVAAMRPIPHIRHQKMLPFSGISESNGHDGGQVKANLPVVPSIKHSMVGANPVNHRKSLSTSYQAGALTYLVPTGRRDGLVSLASDTANLPGFTDSVAVQKQKFAAKGLSTLDLVTLVGGHTIGTVACQFIRYRLYNFTTSGGADPSIDPTFLPTLQTLCPSNGDGNKRIGLDNGSSDKFDHSFFNNLRNSRGILESDQRLWEDGSTKNFVQRFIGIRGLAGLTLNVEFGKAIIKMSNIEVKTGTNGEIRKVCSAIN